MSSSKQNARKLIEKYLHGTCSGEEKERVERWYEQMPAGRFDLDEELAEEDLEAIWSRLQAGRRKSRTIRLWKITGIAASVLLLTGIGLYLYGPEPGLKNDQTECLVNDVPPGGNRATLTLADGKTIHLDHAANGELARQNGITVRKADDGQLIYEMNDHAQEASGIAYNTVTTPKGGQYQVWLPDGSKVWLNAASSLRYPTRFKEDERIVTLTGEGYFEVSSGSKQPFIVRSKGQQVRVTGTRFNIHAYSDAPSASTSLIEGSVQVTQSGSGRARRLKPGEQSRISDEAFEIHPVDTEESIAWKNGYFIFSDTDLKTILQQLERWYDVEVDYTWLPEKRFYGKISRHVPLSKVLDMMEQTGNLNFNIEGKRIIMMHP